MSIKENLRPKDEGDITIIVVLVLCVILMAISMFCTYRADRHNKKVENTAEIMTEKQLKEALENDSEVYVYGSLTATDPIGFEEVDGDYIWMWKVEEERIYGRYYSHWRSMDNGEEKSCHQMSILNTTFSAENIKLHNVTDNPIKKDYIVDSDRIAYYGLADGAKGTLRCTISKGEIISGEFYPDMTIKEVKNSLKTGS